MGRVLRVVAVQVIHTLTDYPLNHLRRQGEELGHTMVTLQVVEGLDEVLVTHEKLTSISAIRVAYNNKANKEVG